MEALSFKDTFNDPQQLNVRGAFPPKLLTTISESKVIEPTQGPNLRKKFRLSDY